MSSIGSVSSGGYSRPDPTQLQQFLFKKADTDGDGSVSKDELSTLLEKNPRLAKALSSLTGNTDGTTATPEAIFNALDTDGDGQVTEAQFKTALTNARPAAPGGDGDESGVRGHHHHRGGQEDFSKILDKVFAKGDSDGDGYLSQDDLSTMMKNNPALSQDLATVAGKTYVSAADAFAALDGDGDGKVSANEFTSAVAKAHQQSTGQDIAALMQAFLQRMQTAGYGQGGAASSNQSGGSVLAEVA